MAQLPIVYNFVTATLLAAGVLLAGAGCSTVATTSASETSETSVIPAPNQHLSDSIEQVQKQTGSCLWNCNHDRPNMLLGGMARKQEVGSRGLVGAAFAA